MYNEMVILKLVQSMTKLLTSPPDIFRDQIIRHFQDRGKNMYNRIHDWMELSNLCNAECKTENPSKKLNNYLKKNISMRFFFSQFIYSNSRWE